MIIHYIYFEGNSSDHNYVYFTRSRDRERHQSHLRKQDCDDGQAGMRGAVSLLEMKDERIFELEMQLITVRAAANLFLDEVGELKLPARAHRKYKDLQAILQRGG